MIETIQNTLMTLFDGNVVEIRVLGTSQGTHSGYYDDYHKAAKDVMKFSGKQNVYVTLNRPNSDLIARSNNRLTPYSKISTSDKDILRYVYLIVDFDPNRISGIPSTDAEKAKAKHLMMTVGSELKVHGFSAPIVCDSGNGYHLLYKIDLENTAENQQLIKSFLSYLSFRHSTDEVSIDTTMYNPSRITKLYGTVACKGDSTVDRPHRLSSMIRVPDNIEVTDIETIRAYVKPVAIEDKGKGRSSDKQIDIPKFIEQHQLKLAYSAPYQDGMKYILSECPFEESHKDKSAYIIQFASGKVAAGCHHNSCSGKNWQTLLALKGISQGAGDKKTDESEKQADTVIRLAKDADFFVDDLENGYMAVKLDGHTETMPLKSPRFKSYLTKLYYDYSESALSTDALSQALKVFEMKAMFSGQEQRLTRRIASHEGSYYYDLCNSKWSVVRYDESGVSIVEDGPVLFTRSKNMKAQQQPDLSIQPHVLPNILSRYFRFHREADRILFVVYLVTCFLPDIAHVVLVLYGEKGAAKSTTMRMIKKIVDPSVQELLTMPSSNQDLAVTLYNSYMPCFDNLDGLSAEKSDMLCMAATGGALTKRTLYTDSEETIIEIKRPIGINGINVVATRADLLDRSILLELIRIPKSERKTEKAIWEAFEKDIPKVLGGIFNTVKEAIKVYGDIQLDEVGRMADFTYWGCAAAQVMGIGGDVFLRAYLDNQDSANEEALTSHPVAAAVIALLRDEPSWKGSVSALLGALQQVAELEHINTKVKSWPKDANVLSRRLKEVKSNLEEIGIRYDIRQHGSHKQISLSRQMNSSGSVTDEKMQRRLKAKREEKEPPTSGLFDDMDD